jgi:hypothetical protein
VLANQPFINEALKKGVTIRVYNKAGRAREFAPRSSTNDVVSFAMSTAP